MPCNLHVVRGRPRVCVNETDCRNDSWGPRVWWHDEGFWRAGLVWSGRGRGRSACGICHQRSPPPLLLLDHLPWVIFGPVQVACCCTIYLEHVPWPRYTWLLTAMVRWAGLLWRFVLLVFFALFFACFYFGCSTGCNCHACVTLCCSCCFGCCSAING